MLLEASRDLTRGFTSGITPKSYPCSDRGGLVLWERERHGGLLRDFADWFIDCRDQRSFEHKMVELATQWIHGLVLGYEHLNDCDQWRDPLPALICGKRDLLGQDRLLERDKSQSAWWLTPRSIVWSRVLSPLTSHKIQAQPDKIEELLIKRGVKAVPRKSAGVVPDVLAFAKFRSTLFAFRRKRENSTPTT
jgi:Transposase DDE domain group 1